jgi:hypothetical protein
MEFYLAGAKGIGWGGGGVNSSFLEVAGNSVVGHPHRFDWKRIATGKLETKGRIEKKRLKEAR